MSFNADVQVLTQPGSTGNQTYSLAANFDPKAVILWATPQAGDGSIVHYSLGVGFGTYRGSVVQQRYVALRGLDVAAAADVARGSNNNALLCLLTSSAGSAARDLEVALVSMQTGATSEVVLNWVNLHTTASIRVFMLVLGGSDITDALSGAVTLNTGVTTQDVTVGAGFGKPELLFFASNGQVIAGDSAVSPAFHFGFAKQGEAGRGFGFYQEDGNTASITAARQRSDRVLNEISTTDTALGRLDTTAANWPTDGFRMLYDANPLNASLVYYLALRTTAQITTGANTAPTSGGLPVAQDNNAGFVPKLGFLFGWNLAAASTIQTAAADQVGFGIGAYDGATEAWAGFTEDDAATTMIADSEQSAAKVIRNYLPNAALQSEADGSFSGNNFRLSWNDIDSVAREYQWLAIGDASIAAFDINAAPGSYALSGVAAGVLSGRMVNAVAGSYALTGALAGTYLGRFLSAAPGAYALTGADTGLLAARLLSADPGVYVLSGFEAELLFAGLAAFALDAQPGAYVLTGAAATPLAARLLSVDPGSYALSGVDLAALAGRVLSANPGTYALTGLAASAVAGRMLNAVAGSYTLTGVVASGLAARLLSATPGVYVVTGAGAELLLGIVGQVPLPEFTPASVDALTFVPTASDPLAFIVATADGLTFTAVVTPDGLVFTPTTVDGLTFTEH